jgi:cell division protein FtsB
MSKYIDMITKTNKTLTEKYDQIKVENENLNKQIVELTKEIYKLKEENYTLRQQKCDKQFVCHKFDKAVSGFMQTFNYINENSK